MDTLDFEQPIVELETQLDELRKISESASGRADLRDEIARLERKHSKLIDSIFSRLDPWQITQVARHPQRPRSLDYIKALIADFEELHGDRQFRDDPAIVAGIGRFDGNPVAVVAHQKGNSTEENIRRNFGMPRPEGYRKARRLFRLAERFGLPLLSFIDTPGAYPGIGAEERGQSEAIAVNLGVMARLKTPIVGAVIGEGGSGGALAIGVCDRLLMLQYSIYSVISPEGCASILWKDAARARQAAGALGLTAERLLDLELIDAIVPEPLGGAHRNFRRACANLRRVMRAALAELVGISPIALVEARARKLNSC